MDRDVRVVLFVVLVVMQGKNNMSPNTFIFNANLSIKLKV